MPSNWPELSLALALALVAAYVATSFLGRRIERWLRAHRARRARAHPRGQPAASDSRAAVRRHRGDRRDSRRCARRLQPASTRATPRRFTEWLLGAGVRIVFIAIAATSSSASATGDRQLEREMSAGTGLDVIERTKRAQTLGALLQNSLTVVVVIIAGLMVLRELDVDITPALTGAGIVGLAVGFGAQTLVRDVISGFFLILEDQVRVGDVAVVNGRAGWSKSQPADDRAARRGGHGPRLPERRGQDAGQQVEGLRLLRDHRRRGLRRGPRSRGRGHEGRRRLADRPTPSSASTSSSRSRSTASTRSRPTQLVVKGRIKTVPLKQWTVGRELRKRIAKTFRERGIRMPGCRW